MKVGFVGLGQMGGNMALRLLERGHDLIVTDINRDSAAPQLSEGAEWAATPAQLASKADVILSSLPGPAQVEAVALGADGILEGISEGKVYVDVSTSSPLVIRKVAAAFAEKGASVIDAPVSGGSSHSRAGTLVFFVGGPAEILEQARPVLADLSKDIIHIGPIGGGSVAKIANNAIGLSTLSLLSEVISLGVKAGIDHNTMHKVLREGAYGQGHYLNLIVPQVAFKHRYEPANFALDLGRKDVALATSLARELDVPLPMINLVEQGAVEMVGRGHGKKDSAILFSLQELRAGVSIHDDDAQSMEL